jgi:hypothetical protein
MSSELCQRGDSQNVEPLHIGRNGQVSSAWQYKRLGCSFSREIVLLSPGNFYLRAIPGVLARCVVVENLCATEAYICAWPDVRVETLACGNG